MSPTAAPTRYTATPIGADFGYELSGIDLSTATDAELADIAALYRKGSVMVIRGQNLSPDALVRFGKALGQLENHTREQFTLPGYPTIYILSNKEVDGKRIGVHRDGMGWHTDGSYLREPLDTTVLYALESPPEGADTLLADMRAAYLALPEEERAALDDKKVLHSFVFLIGQLDPEARSVVTAEQAERAPDVVHPLVLTRADRTRSLYLSSGSTREILGEEPAEGRQRVRDLITHATQDKFIYRHKWQVGDILLWNNRHTMHRATEYDDKRYTRLVHRLWVAGQGGLGA
ncbi:MAG: TauD/TfdA family dioxygenase [Alphaproteobacteria bacterium]|nr:TauD/TfdA family dioxygenase [Alphaproteobacteria bacterium]MBU0795438.1 TauD/TfdA family dioxygenase [Alphaproteobacteria bacterium]MBU0876607.1 TauD/TfdA family dioxygenase [Alphaproteobacteria bacterium]MBU1769308.1 TauD/TfdA family dioxygenase [Alphaproteobacteria bacterium]